MQLSLHANSAIDDQDRSGSEYAFLTVGNVSHSKIASPARIPSLCVTQVRCQMRPRLNFGQTAQPCPRPLQN